MMHAVLALVSTMPRVGASAAAGRKAPAAGSAPLPAVTPSATAAALDSILEAAVPALQSRLKNSSYGFGDVCSCARCMRRAGPVREDVQ